MNPSRVTTENILLTAMQHNLLNILAAQDLYLNCKNENLVPRGNNHEKFANMRVLLSISAKQ